MGEGAEQADRAKPIVLRAADPLDLLDDGHDYGPGHPGVALRLLHLDHAVDVSALDEQAAGRWAGLIARVQATSH